MGGGDAPEQEESKAERAQAESAVASWNERFDDGYVDLEKQAITDAGVDHASYLGGRASADIAEAERGAYAANLRDGATGFELQRTGNAVSDSITAANVSTEAEAQNLRTNALVTTAKTGRNVATTASQGLRSAATLGASRATNKVQNDILVSNAEASAKGAALQGAITGAGLRQEGYRFGKGGIEKSHEPGLMKNKALSSEDKLKNKDKTIGWGKTAGLMVGSL
tara:strand:+ start:7666 stop:8340 length:675 start_codon:yes stop_codon:yes gene_type:complete